MLSAHSCNYCLWSGLDDGYTADQVRANQKGEYFSRSSLQWQWHVLVYGFILFWLYNIYIYIYCIYIHCNVWNINDIFVWHDAILDITGDMNRYPMKCHVTVLFSAAHSRPKVHLWDRRGYFNLVLHLPITGELTKDSMTTMQLKGYWLLWYLYVAPAFLSSVSWAKVPSNCEAYYKVCDASTRHWAKQLLLLGSWCWTGESRNCSCCCFASSTIIGVHFFRTSILAALLGFIFTGPFKGSIRCGAFTFSVCLMKTRAGDFVAFVGFATAG